VNDLGQNDIPEEIDEGMPEYPQEDLPGESAKQLQLLEALERSVTILKLIAESESDAQLKQGDFVKAIAELDLGTEPTTIAALRSLHRWGMVHRRVRKDKRLRGGKPYIYYQLSQRGLENLITCAFDMHLSTAFFNAYTFRHLAHKYQHMLPTIFELWDTFKDAGIEDQAFRRLRLFLAIYHGKQLEDLVYHASDAQPTLDPIKPLLQKIPRSNKRSKKRRPTTLVLDFGRHGVPAFSENIPPEYDCNPDDDLEAFLDPSLWPSDRQWLSALHANGALRSIFVRSLLKQAKKTMESVNDRLRQFAVTELTTDDLNLRRDLLKIMNSLRKNISVSRKAHSKHLG
jgi:hypothetical protein